MILGVDTDALVHWLMSGARHHADTRRFFDREVSVSGARLGITSQVLCEVLHVTTDPNRFENPLTVNGGIRLLRELWESTDVVRIEQPPAVVARVLELMETLRLGRKRILDTALAATLEAAGIEKIVTLNVKDFRVFPFLEAVSPVASPPSTPPDGGTRGGGG